MNLMKCIFKQSSCGIQETNMQDVLYIMASIHRYGYNNIINLMEQREKKENVVFARIEVPVFVAVVDCNDKLLTLQQICCCLLRCSMTSEEDDSMSVETS